MDFLIFQNLPGDWSLIIPYPNWMCPISSRTSTFWSRLAIAVFVDPENGEIAMNFQRPEKSQRISANLKSMESDNFVSNKIKKRQMKSLQYYYLNWIKYCKNYIEIKFLRNSLIMNFTFSSKGIHIWKESEKDGNYPESSG